ncbi:hypothetical protein M501DRAFT_994228 [Patellaria atrata CBS 101060]|uniref:RING-type domain-containing protein n=1 Tax=Patellaria atrata CBS 101060 TaxID=1346257 RepID=A0A9P4VV98_9PEZI|nr:hypothetical protein M501DRAFT_994228 [Patellaria atrata CBS 101060]
MQHEDIFRGASTKDFERYICKISVSSYISNLILCRYDRLVARALLAQDPNFIWCIAPGCGSGQLQEMSSNDPSLQKFICISCNSEHCIKHRVKWHAGESCEQYEYRVSGKQRRDAEEAASTALMNTTSKQCPGKKCGWRIEKSG